MIQSEARELAVSSLSAQQVSEQNMKRHGYLIRSRRLV